MFRFIILAALLFFNLTLSDFAFAEPTQNFSDCYLALQQAFKEPIFAAYKDQQDQLSKYIKVRLKKDGHPSQDLKQHVVSESDLATGLVTETIDSREKSNDVKFYTDISVAVSRDAKGSVQSLKVTTEKGMDGKARAIAYNTTNMQKSVTFDFVYEFGKCKIKAVNSPMPYSREICLGLTEFIQKNANCAMGSDCNKNLDTLLQPLTKDTIDNYSRSLSEARQKNDASIYAKAVLDTQCSLSSNYFELKSQGAPANPSGDGAEKVKAILE